MFDKILIANRGEIACRIIKTCNRLSIKTVAVYSEPDQDALHVKMADEAYLLGPAPVKESYLKADKIIQIAKKTGAQAIHPGYGFLSENADFAQKCAAENIVFIGPSVEAIIAMGSKSAAKEIMQKAGVPLVTGYHGTEQSEQKLLEEAEKTGFPVLLKATAGGGGKGMRIVQKQQDFSSALSSCKRESLSSFNDDQVLVEKYLVQPRHVEIQIFADTNGHCVHLFERDCSLQRRHQKIIEEAPAPSLPDNIRKSLGEVAIKAAKAIDYVGAGTVEFLYDSDGQFYFMEMNTRLQVEHPVTEMITGEDLVEWQLLVAYGENLPKSQHEITASGHAFEVRIYAEDPEQDFFPSTGKIRHLQFPAQNLYTRIDSGIVESDEISIYYDPMIAKLIVWDKDRNSALRRLSVALSQIQLVGVKTNLAFLAAISNNLAFAQCKLSTHFIEQQHDHLFSQQVSSNSEILALISVYLFLQNQRQSTLQNQARQDPFSPWGIANLWRNGEVAFSRFNLSETLNDLINHYSILVTPQPAAEQEQFKTIIIKNDQPFAEIVLSAEIHQNDASTTSANTLLFANIAEKRICSNIVRTDNEITLYLHGENFTLHLEETSDHLLEDNVDNNLLAPMPGTIIQISVHKNDHVQKGDKLLIMEAMKMEHSISAPADGTIEEVFFNVGEQVTEGTELVKFCADKS